MTGIANADPKTTRQRAGRQAETVVGVGPTGPANTTTRLPAGPAAHHAVPGLPPEEAIAQPHPLVVFVSFFRNQIKVFETKPVEFSEALDRRLNTVPIQISIPLQPLPSGDYECQVTVIDWLGQRATFWQKPILLVP